MQSFSERNSFIASDEVLEDLYKFELGYIKRKPAAFKSFLRSWRRLNVSSKDTGRVDYRPCLLFTSVINPADEFKAGERSKSFGSVSGSERPAQRNERPFAPHVSNRRSFTGTKEQEGDQSDNDRSGFLAYQPGPEMPTYLPESYQSSGMNLLVDLAQRESAS